VTLFVIQPALANNFSYGSDGRGCNVRSHERLAAPLPKGADMCRHRSSAEDQRPPLPVPIERDFIVCIMKVEQFAHLRHGRSTRGWSRLFPALALLGGILMAPAIILAAGTLQWTAQLNGSGPVLGPFSTNEQALQALGAAVVISRARPVWWRR
jgi:hypothetical protein